MGAYLAGSDPGIGLLSPGDTREYDRTRGASVHTAGEAVIPVRWRRRIHYQYAQPEADRSWYTARLWRADRDGLDYRQGLSLIDAVMER